MLGAAKPESEGFSAHSVVGYGAALAWGGLPRSGTPGSGVFFGLVAATLVGTGAGFVLVGLTWSSTGDAIAGHTSGLNHCRCRPFRRG